MKVNKIILLLLILVSFISSCTTTRDTNFLQNIPKDYQQVSEPDYRVIAGDQLRIKIFSLYGTLSEELGAFAEGGVLNVRQDGTIKIPYLGRVYVEDLTLFEIGTLLTEKFGAMGEGVTATVSLNNMYISLLGEMGSSRIYMPKPIMSISEVMALASVPNLGGDREKVTILRQTKDGSVIKEFDIRSKDIVDSEFFYIQPNDVVYVAKSKKVFVGNATSLGGALGVVTGLIGLVIMLVRLF